jgi:muramidase (phage lysozyme)
MATAEELARYLSNPNVQKMLRTIGQAEGTIGDKIADPYRVGFGGSKIESLDAHPNVLVDFTQTDGKKNKTSAAGAYQFLKSTWDEEARELGLKDFSPRSQDLAAINRLSKRGALDDVLSGRMDAAVAKLGAEWASLPSSPYAQPKRSPGFIEQALNSVVPAAEAAPVPKIDPTQVQWDEPKIDASQVQWDEPKREAPQADAEPTQAQKLQASVVGRTAQGAVMDPLNAGAQLLVNAAPSGVVDAVNSATRYVNELPLIGPVTKALGMTPASAQQVNQGVVDQERQYQAARQATGQTGFDAARLAGNVIGTAPLAAAMAPAGAMSIPAAVGTAVGSGAVLAGLQPVTEPGDFAQNKLKQMAIGGAASGVLSGAGNALSRLVSPKASTNPQVQLLMDEGVTPTPGQLLGGNVQRAEDKAMSIPIVGDAIRSARGRAVEEFNEAALNRALAPIGQKVSRVGREGVDDVGRAIGDAYDNLMPRLNFKADNQFATELGSLQQMTATLPPAQASQFENIVRNQVVGRLTPQGGATGQNFKAIESELGRLGNSYRSSAVAGERELGMAIGELQSSLRTALERSNPQAAGELSKINQAFANFTRIQRAASGVGAQDGVFTPAQLSSAVRSADTSARKGAYARGSALMQDLTDAGRGVMNQMVPNSGTTDRLMLGAGALGTGMYNPLIPLSLGAASIPYLPGANRLAAALIARRPDIAPQLAQGITSVVPAAGVVAAPALNQVLQK